MNLKTDQYSLKEMILCWIVCFALTALSVVLMPFGTPWADIAWFLAIFSLIAVPLIAVRYIHPRDEVEAGTAILWSWKDFLTGLAAVAMLLIPVALGNHVVRTAFQDLTLVFNWANYSRLETPIYYEFILQILCVALPEEFFYRGYLQTNLLKFFKNRPKWARFAPGLAIVLASVCFAIAHLPSGGPIRLLTFFPGLLFGFLRYKSGGLCGAIFCHAMCNMMMLILNVHYFPI